MKTIIIQRQVKETTKEPVEVKDVTNYAAKQGYHFTGETLEYALSKMQNTDGTNHRFTINDVKNHIDNMGVETPIRSNIYDMTYTANMAYADFYPDIIPDERTCVKYALLVANDPDGYEGIEFCRWIADIMGKNVKVNWEQFV